ncbi:GNAT family N-acetyltransferase [Paenibacillus sp. NFR01]|uniref:GNAT family N-acetyltransferase n=1 Tax=Paenibacillus sp. NFR01 TaxID=1566279 RepID=UPI0008D1B6F5|nr:GNAT family N-acetyltransferase [Paenibacillus sp. NFR01]SET32040.1 N-acetylglutamate synthase, GNAT family [Paenibacillus sp. NFR01]
MIRKAKPEDGKKLSELLSQLGYPDTEVFMKAKMERLLADPNEELMVYEEAGQVVACISLHYIPQLGLEGDIASISYLVVDASIRSKGVGKKLEDYASASARKRGCDRIQVHCQSRRTDAHRFYERQCFTEAPKYFSKSLLDH